MKSHIRRLSVAIPDDWRRGAIMASARILVVSAIVAGCLIVPGYGRTAPAEVSLSDDIDSGFGDIFVPYQDLAQLIEPADRAMLMDRDEFEKLLAAAQANAEGAGSLELGQVTRAEYTGKVSGEELVLSGDLEVVSMSAEPVTVPLGFAHIGLTRVLLDGMAAPLGYDKQGRLTLIVRGKGTHRLEMAGTVKLEELSTGGMQFGIFMPAAVAGKMQLSAPGDLEMHTTLPVSQPVYNAQMDTTDVEITVGGQGRLTVVLLGNGRREAEQAILLGESVSTINLTELHQLMSCFYTVQVLRRGVRELQFDLPGEWTVTDVTCPSLVRWSIEEAAGPGRHKVLTVRLRSAKVGTTPLHIKAAASRSGDRWGAPRILLVGAAYQRGYVMVNTDETLRVRSEKVARARREDASTAAVPGLVSTSAGRLYFHWGDNWSVELELAEAVLKRSIKEQQRFIISPEQLLVRGQFEVTAIDRELFNVSFVLPAQGLQWEIRRILVNNEKHGFEYRTEQGADRQLLIIELARPIMPEKLANILVELQHVPADWQWPSDAAARTVQAPLIGSQADTVAGHVLVSAEGDLDAVPTKAPEEMEEVPVARMASLQIPGKFEYAYSYKSPAKGQVELEVSRRRPRIEAGAVGLITVQPEGFTADWRITYAISRATAKRLYLLADRSLEEQIRITSPSIPISSKNIVAAGERTMPLSAELARRYSLWQLNLDHAGFGDVTIDVHYDRPLPGDAFSAPLVRPICGGQTNEVLAIQASEELSLTIKASGAKEIDAIDLPTLPVAAGRILGAYRLDSPGTTPGSDAAVILDTDMQETYAVPSALAVLGELTTYVDRQGGQRTQAVFRIANVGRQFLTFRLPKEAELWSLRVGNQQAKPQHSAQGDYQVPLAKSRAPIAVKIVYAYRPAESDLEELELGGVEIPGVEINVVWWNVVPPPGYQVTSQQTRMQAYNLVAPTPAYVQLYRFMADHMFVGMRLIPSLSRVQELSPRVLAATNLSGIGKAIMVYRNDNNGRWPDSLDRLVEADYITSKQLHDARGRRFEYLRPPGDAEVSPDTIIARSGIVNGRLDVLYADTHVESIAAMGTNLSGMAEEMKKWAGAPRDEAAQVDADHRVSGGTEMDVVDAYGGRRAGGYGGDGGGYGGNSSGYGGYGGYRGGAYGGAGYMAAQPPPAQEEDRAGGPATATRGGVQMGVTFSDQAQVMQSESAPAPQGPGHQVAVTGFGTGTAVEGRFTLPVELAPTPGAGPTARFAGLGTARLVVGLMRQSRMEGAWLLGLILIVTVGVAKASATIRSRAVVIVATLSLASLLAIWQPEVADFANGAFIGGICLLPLYLLIALIKWLLPRLRLGGVVNRQTATAGALILLLLVSAGEARAAERGRAQESAQPASSRQPSPDIGTPLPPIIIPYEGDPTAAEKSDKVLIPYSRYVKLWNQAHPEDPMDGLKPGTDISLADVHYRATEDNRQMKFTLTAQVRTYGAQWVVLPLPTQGLAVTDVTFDGKPAQWQGAPESAVANAQMKSSKDGMVLMLPGGASGKLELAAIGTPTYMGQRATLSFSLPPLPAAVMTVVLAEADRELEVDQIDGTLGRKMVNDTVEWVVPLGMRRSFTLRWLPRAGGGAADRTLSAVSEHEVYSFDWAMLAATKITYSFSGGEHDRFTVLVPQGITLTALEGANIRDFRQVEEKAIDGESFRTIEVRLHRAAKKKYELTVRWLTSMPALGEPRRLELVRAGDVTRESGTATLNAAGGIEVKVVDVTGCRRVSMEATNTEATGGRTTPVARYYWPYRPFSLSLQFSRPPVSAEANLDQLVRVNTDQVQLLVQAVLQTQRGRLFGGDFMLPEGYELLSVVGPLVENFHEQQTPGGRSLHVKFSSATQQATMALVLVRNKVELEDFQAPVITAVDSAGTPLANQKGRLAVQMAASLDAQTVSSENLKSIVPRSLRGWLDRKQIRAVQFAYSYEEPNPVLQLKITPQPTRIQVEVFAGLVVKTTAASYTYRLRYNITGTPVDHLRFQMPSEYAPLAAVDSPAKRSITQFVAEQGQTGWDIALLNEVTGVVDVTVNFTVPVDETTRALSLPRIDTNAPEGYRVIAAVQNISRHEISLKDWTNMDHMPASEQRRLIPEQMRESLQYVLDSFESGWSLSLGFKPAKAAARIQAVVDLLAVTTVMDRSGRCRYEAKVALQNRSEQFLKVEVPKGLRLWSATVAGQPVKPVTAPDSPEGEVLIPLVKTSPGGLPYDIYLYFADEGEAPLIGPLNGITRLEPPAVSIKGIQVMQTTWSVRLPAGYEYLRPGGNMSPVAGTVEMLSLDIEARLKQLERLDKTYREIAGTSTQTEKIAGANWREFNTKLAGEIKHAQRYLETNRDEVVREDYDRLKSKLARQQGIQNTVLWGNSAFVEQQQEMVANNINGWLNADAGNGGNAGGQQSEVLQEEPEFVTRNFSGNLIRLEKQLEASEKQQKEIAQAMQQAENGDNIVIINGYVARDRDGDGIISAGDKQAQMGRILEEINRDNDAQVRMEQEQIARQLAEIKDNRYQRLFQKKRTGKALGVQAEMSWSPAVPAPAAEPVPAPPAKSRENARTGLTDWDVGGEESRDRKVDRGSEVLGSRRRKGGLLTVDDAEPTITNMAAKPEETRLSNMLVAAEPTGEMETYYELAQGVEPYVAKGTYSLPISLPDGAIRLDFARPGPDARLTLWAVPTRLLQTLYATIAVIGAALVLLGLIRIWPRVMHPAQISTRWVIIYIVAFVVLAVLLGLLGVVIGIAGILISEVVRSSCRRPAEAVANS